MMVSFKLISSLVWILVSKIFLPIIFSPKVLISECKNWYQCNVVNDQKLEIIIDKISTSVAIRVGKKGPRLQLFAIQTQKTWSHHLEFKLQQKKDSEWNWHSPRSSLNSKTRRVLNTRLNTLLPSSQRSFFTLIFFAIAGGPVSNVMKWTPSARRGVARNATVAAGIHLLER